MFDSLLFHPVGPSYTSNYERLFFCLMIMYCFSAEANLRREFAEMGWTKENGKLMFICSEIVVFGVLVFEENS